MHVNTVSCHLFNGSTVLFVFLPALLPYINEKLCFFPPCYNTRHLYRQRIPLQVVECKLPTISLPLSLPVILLLMFCVIEISAPVLLTWNLGKQWLLVCKGQTGSPALFF